MKFYKLSDSIYKENKESVRIKTEYFWHYWDFLFTENRNLILVDEPKFISQVSLLNKIEKHLEWNSRISSRKLVKYFNNHPYFKKSNLIIRSNAKLEKQIFIIRRKVEGFNNESASSQNDLLGRVKKIKKDYFKFDEYSEELINKLVKLIFSNRKLNENCKEDLKFLCNSIIDLFIIKGYSLQFIKGLLSNIIFHSSNKSSFKYNKNYNDFVNYKEWKEYVEEEYKLLSLKDRITYLKYFLTLKKNSGFFIFRVEGINFDSDPIEIFGVKFYNPQRNKFLKYVKIRDDDKRNSEYEEYCVERELFNNENVNSKNDKFKGSRCNVIVPVEYLYKDVHDFDSYNFPTKSFIEAFSRAQISFIEFKRYIKSYTTEHFFEDSFFQARVSKESILIDCNFNYHKASDVSSKSKEIVFKVDEVRLDMINENLSFKGKIKSQNTFFYHIANSNALISGFILENHKFNFKSLWIECIEPYFEGVQEFIVFAKKSIKIRTNLFSKYQILLSNALRCQVLSYNSYCLNKEEMKQIGIGELNVGDKILGKDLEKNFELLPNGSLLDEFKNEMRNICNNEVEFSKKIDKWVSETVKIAYDERNIEVHYNLVDYYNDVSVKKDILFISSCVIGAINDAIFLNNAQSIKDAKKCTEDKYVEMNKKS